MTPDDRYQSLARDLSAAQAELDRAAKAHRRQALLLLISAHPAGLSPAETQKSHRYALQALTKRPLQDAVEVAVSGVMELRDKYGVRLDAQPVTVQ